MRVRYVKVVMVGVVLGALAAFRALSEPSCAQRAGATTDEIDSRCAVCVWTDEGTWSRMAVNNTNECSGTVYNDNAGRDLSCGNSAPCYKDGLGQCLSENVSIRPKSGFCAAGTCIGTLGPVTNYVSLTIWSSAACPTGQY